MPFLLNPSPKMQDMPYQAYYAVYDGHNGVEAAHYAAIHVLPNIVRHPEFTSDLSKAIKDGIKATDDYFCLRVRKVLLKWENIFPYG